MANSEKVKKNIIHPSIEVIDKYTLKFHLKKPYPPFNYILSIPSFSIIKKDKNTLIGSGPFKILETNNSDFLRIQKNEEYINQKPFINKMSIHKIDPLLIRQNFDLYKSFDLLLGIPRALADKVNISNEFELNKINSLTFTHIFFNMKKRHFRDKLKRKTIALTLQKSFKNIHRISKFYQYNPHFFPKGLMPLEYYDIKKINYENDRLLNFNKTLKIICQKHYFNDDMIDIINKDFLSYGIKLDWIFVGSELLTVINKYDYDLLIVSYMGNFPDPDGYLDPLRKNGILNFGNTPSSKLLKSLKDFRFIQDPAFRLQNYSNAFKIFEDEYYLIPLFQASFPIVRKKNIILPIAKYRYESELWKINRN